MKTHYAEIYLGIFFCFFMLVAPSKRLKTSRLKPFFLPLCLLFGAVPISLLDRLDTINGWKNTTFSGVITSDVEGSHNRHRYVVTGEEPASFLDEFGSMETFKAGQTVKKRKGFREVELITDSPQVGQ